MGEEMQKKEAGKRAATEVADEILKFLRTGETREIGEVADSVHISERGAEEVLGYLERMGFIRRKAEITNSGLDFLVKFLERMRSVKRGVQITDFGLEFLKLPEGEE